MAELPYEEEILDLVDINDKVIGQITHEVVFNFVNDGHGYVRGVNAFILNADGKLWIPRRRPEKRIAPNGLDYSVGEHVMSGETYDDAVVRGFEEELNMVVSMDQLEQFSITKPRVGMPAYFTGNYIMRSNENPSYNLNDFTGAEWLSPAELINRLRNGDTGKQSLIDTTEYLLSYLSKNSRH